MPFCHECSALCRSAAPRSQVLRNHSPGTYISAVLLCPATSLRYRPMRPLCDARVAILPVYAPAMRVTSGAAPLQTQSTWFRLQWRRSLASRPQVVKCITPLPPCGCPVLTYYMLLPAKKRAEVDREVRQVTPIALRAPYRPMPYYPMRPLCTARYCHG
eukprot:1083104-Rhodomonas_salina.1